MRKVLTENLSNIRIPLKNEFNVELFMKPDYLNHLLISGNKLRKLKYNIEELKSKGFKRLLTFGGAYSNHIVATAAAGFENEIETIGVIRGEELHNRVSNNPSLQLAKEMGMEFHFVSRADYRNKTSPEFIENLNSKFGRFFLLPEGGTNKLAIKGCEEIITESDKEFNYICCPVGTGGTISGIINKSKVDQKVLGFPALKGDFLVNEINKYTSNSNWRLITEYHFGGYAKINKELIEFINNFKLKYDIPLDPIYTGKMMYGIFEMIRSRKFEENSRILAIHTGGLQGINGMNLKLKLKGLPQIDI